MMQMSYLIETVCQFAMANSMCCYGNVLRRKNGHILRWALVLEA